MCFCVSISVCFASWEKSSRGDIEKLRSGVWEGRMLQGVCSTGKIFGLPPRSHRAVTVPLLHGTRRSFGERGTGKDVDLCFALHEEDMEGADCARETLRMSSTTRLTSCNRKSHEQGDGSIPSARRSLGLGLPSVRSSDSRWCLTSNIPCLQRYGHRTEGLESHPRTRAVQKAGPMCPTPRNSTACVWSDL